MRPGLRIDVEVQVVLARDVRAWPHVLLARAARRRAIGILEQRQELAEAQLLLGQPLGRDGLRASARAPLLTDLAADGQLVRTSSSAARRRPRAVMRERSMLELVARISSIAPPSLPQLPLQQVPSAPEAPEENARALAARDSGSTTAAPNPRCGRRGRRPRAARRRAPCPAACDAPDRTPGARSSRSKPDEQLLQPALDRFDLVLEAEERALDLFDGVALGHHPLDGVDPADDGRPGRAPSIPGACPCGPRDGCAARGRAARTCGRSPRTA